jgi:predicted metalloprotease
VEEEGGESRRRKEKEVEEDVILHYYLRLDHFSSVSASATEVSGPVKIFVRRLEARVFKLTGTLLANLGHQLEKHMFLAVAWDFEQMWTSTF